MTGGGSGGDIKEESEPWEAQKPYLQSGFSEAQRLYQSATPEYYPDPTYTEFSPQTLAGLGAMQNRAIGGSPLESGAQQTVYNTLSGGNLYGSPAMGMLAPYAAGQNLYDNPLFGLAGSGAAGQDVGTNPLYGLGGGTAGGNQLYSNPLFGLTSGIAGGGAVGANPIYDYLGGVAGGEEIGGNPELDALYERAAGRMGDVYSTATAPSTLAGFSMAGRGGSPAMQEVQSLQARDLGDRLGDLGTSLYGNAYATDRAQQLGAAQALGGTFSGDISQWLQAAGQQGGAFGQERGLQQGMQQALGGTYSGELGRMDQLQQLLGGAYEQGVGSQLGAIGGIGGAYDRERGLQQQAAFGAPDLSQGIDYGNIERLLQTGGALESKDFQTLEDSINRWNFGQAAPQQKLEDYMRTISGSYGGQTTQSKSLGMGNYVGMATDALTLPLMFKGG